MTLQSKSRVLIMMADDDDDDCLLVRDALREWNPAADIRFASDGQTLMDYLHSCETDCKSSEKPCPDLILLDLNMPQKSGREALREIRADARLKSIPVIILSTSCDQRDINFCHSHGANSFISKSSDFQGFVEIIKALGVYWFGAVSLPVIGPLPDARIQTEKGLIFDTHRVGPGRNTGGASMKDQAGRNLGPPCVLSARATDSKD